MTYSQRSRESKSQQEFVGKLADILCPGNYHKATLLQDLLDERINELAEKKASDALDREFNRGDYSRY